MYGTPISQEYETRGCKVKIDASLKDRVELTVQNIKTGVSSKCIYLLSPLQHDKGYSEKDMSGIHNALNELIDQHGETECETITFTNTICS